MAVNDITSFAGPFTGNGVTTVFPFTFAAFDESEVRVSVNGATVTTGFTINLTVDGSGSPTGGNVTFSTAPDTGTIVLVSSNPDFTQSTQFTRYGSYFPDFVNTPLDRSAVRDIYLKGRIDALAVLADLAKGDPGPGNTLSIGTVTKIAAGGTPTVSITGTSPAQVINVGLVTGDAGNTGPTGPAGYTSTDTWAHLNAITPSDGAGSTGFAVGPDTGTHTDANGATLVPNTGQFSYQASPAGWIRIGSALGPVDLSAERNTALLRKVTKTKGNASLKALFCADGTKTYSSGTNLSTWVDSSPAGLTASLHSTLFSGANPRPIAASDGITFGAEAGLTVANGLLSNTQASAILLDIDFTVQTSVNYADHAALVTGGAGAAQGDMAVITGGPQSIYSPDPPFAIDTAQVDTTIVKGFWRRGWTGVNPTDGNYNTKMTDFPIFALVGSNPAAQFLKLYGNRSGQLEVGFYNGGANSYQCRTNAMTTALTGKHLVAIMFWHNTMWIVIDGKIAGATYIGTDNCTTFTTAYMNGAARSGNALTPVSGLTHKVRAYGAIENFSFAEFNAVHNALAEYGGKPALRLPKEYWIYVKSIESRGEAQTDDSAWPYLIGGVWSGEVSPVNASHTWEIAKVSVDGLDGRVFACSDYTVPDRIGPMIVGVNNFGTRVNSGYYQPNGEGTEVGMFRALLNDPDCPDVMFGYVSANIGAQPQEIFISRSQPTIPPQSLKGTAATKKVFPAQVYGGASVASQLDLCLSQIAWQADLARAMGMQPVVRGWQPVSGAVVTQPAGQDYETNTIAFYDAVQVWVKKLTNQSVDCAFFIPQHAWSSTGATIEGVSGASTNHDQQVLNVIGKRSSRSIYCLGPANDLSPKGHMPRIVYRSIGERDGKKIADVLFRGIDFQHMHVIAVVNSTNQRKFVFNKPITLKQTFGRAVTGWQTQNGFKSYGILNPGLTLTGDATLATTTLANDTLVFPLSTTPTGANTWSVCGAGTIFTNIFYDSGATGVFKSLDWAGTPDGSNNLPFAEGAANVLHEPACPQTAIVTVVL